MRSIKDKRVLITGGAGFIGSHLADALLSAETAKVVVVDNFFLGDMANLCEAQTAGERFAVYRDDARDLGTMKAIIRKEKIEVVYNLATITLRHSFFNPYGAYRVNVDIAETLLHLLEDGAYQTLIHSSSSEAYGTALYSPMDENHSMNPTTPYAAGKAAADHMIRSFYNVLKLDLSIIRPFNNYGPRQTMEAALAAIIPLTALRIQNGEKPVIEGDGNQTRDFIYVGDTARAFILAYEKDIRGELVNLGSGIEHKISDIIGCVCDYMGYMGEIERAPERAADVRRLCASSEKAKKLLGFEPEIGFEEGIRRTLDWYIQLGLK